MKQNTCFDTTSITVNVPKVEYWFCHCLDLGIISEDGSRQQDMKRTAKFGKNWEVFKS